MDSRFEPWLKRGKQILESGNVREIEFAGATYQVEVIDGDKVFWPLLHFGEEKELTDAFCGCDSPESCKHLAAAYLRIVQTPDGLPLHRRYPDSFFYHFFESLADQLGYEENTFKEVSSHKYKTDSATLFEIEALTPEAEERLKRLISSRPKQNPENSIQFSELSEQELLWWKEGRPSSVLRFALSPFSDLAKWLYIENLEHPFVFTYKEDPSKWPSIWSAKGRHFEIHIEASHQDLITLIPSLDTIHFPLKVYKQVTGEVRRMVYDIAASLLRIEHATHRPNLAGALKIGSWLYKQEEGFYALESHSFFDRETLSKEQLGEALSHHAERMIPFFSIQKESRPLLYRLHFDNDWNLHINAYLFEEKDLQSPKGDLINQQWAYLQGKGFYAVQGALFDQAHVRVAAEDVGSFVNQHRVWLGMQTGFQPHLASVDSQLSYSVTDQLQFFAKHTLEAEAEIKDFGEWVYYKGQGFFSKQSLRVSQWIRPGLSVEKSKISSFIKLNREELETVSHFFSSLLPISSRGVELLINEKQQIVVKPLYIPLKEFEGDDVLFFGDFSYVKNSGFYELPVAMRLPAPYQEQTIIDSSAVHAFISHDLLKLERHILFRDPRLHVPCKADVHVDYLVRNPKGGVKVALTLVTEFGKVSISELLNLSQAKKLPVLFTEAGLIDLREEGLSWIRTLKSSPEEGSKSFAMSTLDFLKLDVQIGFLAPFSDQQQSEITQRLLHELREFRIAETPNLSGLTSTLRLYQQTGVQWLWFLYKNSLAGLLCDDMGLGKTHQSMALMAALANYETHPTRILVICPTSVIYHWQDKLEKFLPKLKVYTFHGMKRELPSLDKGGILLTSYGILRLDQQALGELSFDLAVYDEVQLAKNPSSQVHSAIKGLKAKMRLGLTGTPIENNLRELKALFDLVLPGYMPSEARFRELFITPIERDQDEEKKALLSQMIKPFVLRRRKRDVLEELPEKSEDNAYCTLSREQQTLYQEILKQDREALISQLRDQAEAVPYMHVFSLLTRLKQICNHPALLKADALDYEQHASGKWDRFVELLHEAKRSEQKVVVFSQYLKMLDIIEDYVHKQGWEYAQIRGETIDRRRELKRFQEDPHCFIFIGSLQAAGLGIDLTAGSVVILYDRWWNAARENQAIDRVHRIGQKWAVQVFKLICKGTIEEKIDLMITRKGQLLEQIVTSDDQTTIKQFSRSELIDLLSYSANENLEEPL